MNKMIKAITPIIDRQCKTNAKMIATKISNVITWHCTCKYILCSVWFIPLASNSDLKSSVKRDRGNCQFLLTLLTFFLQTLILLFFIYKVV